MSDSGFTGARAEHLIKRVDLGDFGILYAFETLDHWHDMCDELDDLRGKVDGLQTALEALRSVWSPCPICGTCRPSRQPCPVCGDPDPDTAPVPAEGREAFGLPAGEG